MGSLTGLIVIAGEHMIRFMMAAGLIRICDPLDTTYKMTEKTEHKVW